MLELLEHVAGAVILVLYFGVAVFLPAGVVVAFVLFIGTLLRIGIDRLVAYVPDRVRQIGPLASAGRAARGLFVWVSGLAILLTLVGVSSGGEGNVVIAGFLQLIITLTALQDIVASWFTGRVLNDMLVELQTAEGQSSVESLRRLFTLTTSHLHTTFKPGVTVLAFRWTMAALLTSLAFFYVILEPVRAIRRRLAQIIEGQVRPAVISEDFLLRQAETIAEAVSREVGKMAPAQPAAPVATGPSAAAERLAAAAAAITQIAPVQQRVAIVTWDARLASELQRQLEGAGFPAPLITRSVAEAFATRSWPATVLVDAAHLQWLAPERLPLLVRSRLIAVTHDAARVPVEWQIDAHALEAGPESLLDLLRRRDLRRRGAREPSA